MTTHPEVVRQSDLLNQLVLDRTTMEELGRVEVLWMYPQAHRVLGFIAKSGFLGAKKAAFKLSQIHALGEGGVLTHSEPEATDGDKVSRLESLLNHELWSDGGNKLGKITDCLFNLKTGTITQYLFISNGWAGITGEVYQLPPSKIVSFGKKRVLVSETVETSFAVYQEGISQKLTKTTEHLKEEATQEWRSLTKRAETVTEQAKGRLQSFTEQAKERAQLLSQKAKEKAQVINEQLKQGSQDWAEQARERSQTLADQVKERTQTLGKQVEEGIQTLTVQAEEIFDVVKDDGSSPSASRPDEPDIFENDDDEFWADLSPSPSPAQPDALADDDDDEPWSSPPLPSPSSAKPDTLDDEDELWDSPPPPPAPSQPTAVDDDDDEPWI